jgi:hypothetical protein
MLILTPISAEPFSLSVTFPATLPVLPAITIRLQQKIVRRIAHADFIEAQNVKT